MCNNVCKNCHWYLMTTACLKNHDMRKGLIGECEHFMSYCKSEKEFLLQQQLTEANERAEKAEAQLTEAKEAIRLSALANIASKYQAEKERAEKAEVKVKAMEAVVQAAEEYLSNSICDHAWEKLSDALKQLKEVE